MNDTLKFKTNIKCSSCVAKVTPFLDAEEGIKQWEVDTSTADKILTVETNGMTESEIKNAVEKSGYKIESVS
ncbi:heavy-metal-associated domain-containing protein [Sphingobacterium spiritivorum]|uniref:heavy-metal-associated domain-containing protein n=1 Tax=Sphingobacterium spiritivorum TaxID=258 RepID=UPI00191A0E95|nr:heavy-metal-associated domain-containing protein [Sphingobacterium spiritivorum]QQT25093.1 heavy-metal-associated domain-containing protein [Sphingobacterium spiritivorum]